MGNKSVSIVCYADDAVLFAAPKTICGITNYKICKEKAETVEQPRQPSTD